MRQQLVKNLVFVLAINLLVKAVWIFGIDRNVQLMVGYADYGNYQALLNLALIFQIVLDFGLTQYVGKTIAAAPERLADLFASMLWVRLFLSVLYFLLVSAVAWSLGYSMGQLFLLLGVLAILMLNALLVFLRSNVAALHYFKLDGVLAVADRLLMILVCGALMFLPRWSPSFKIEWFVWAQIVCYAIAALLALLALLRISPVPLRFGFHAATMRQVLRESAPYALLVFLMSVYMRADAVMIERICGTEGSWQAGMYASAFRLLDVANIFGVMFAGMLMPIFARMFAQKESVAPVVRTSVDLMMPLAFLVAIVSGFYSKELMHLLYHRNSGGLDAQIFSFLMYSFPAYCLMYIYSTLLTAKGNIRLLNQISLLIVCVNLPLHYFFISHFKALGAAYVVLMCEWLVAALVIFFAHRQCALPHNYPWLAKHIAFVLMLLFLAWGVQFLSMNWIGQIALLCLSALLLLYLLGLWSIANFRSLLQGRQKV